MRLTTLLALEIAAAAAYETWTGSGYLGALGGKAGVPLLTVSLVTGLPWLGSFGQLAGSVLVRRLSSARKAALAAHLVARGLWLIPLGVGALWGLQTLHSSLRFPTTRWFTLAGITLFIGSFFQAMGMLSWKAWIRELVPDRFHGRLFALRQRSSMAASVAAGLILSLLLTWQTEDHLQPGPFFVGLLSVLAGAGSLILLRMTPELNHRHGPDQPSPGWRKAIAAPLKRRTFRDFTLFGVAHSLAAQLSVPHLGYFLAADGALPLGWVTAMPLFLALGAAGTAPFLGKRADQGYAARILWISGTLLAVSPLSYVILPTEEFLWAAPLEHALKGVAFSGFQISLMKLLLGETDRSDAPEALSIYFAATGIASGAAAVFGAWLASRPEWTSGIPGIIVVSAVGQVAVLGLWAIRKSSIGLRG